MGLGFIEGFRSSEGCSDRVFGLGGDGRNVQGSLGLTFVGSVALSFSRGFQIAVAV